MPKLPPMPKIDRRRPGYPAGYMESDREWTERNIEAVRWLADNASAIRVALKAAEPK